MRFPFYSKGPMILFSEDAGGDTSSSGETQSTLADFKPDAISDGDPVPRSDRDKDDKLPDFGNLFKKDTAKEPEKAPEGGGDTKKQEKPASEAPEAKKEAVKSEAKPAKEAKTAEKEPEKAKEDEKPPGELPEDDKDLDALQPKANAPNHVIQSFKEIKAIAKRERETARAAKVEAERVKAEIATLKEQVGKIPPETEEELNGLRKLSLVLRGEQDPRFRAEFEQKTEAAHGRVYGFLEKHGLAPEALEQIKAAAKSGDIESWPKWEDLISAFKNPVDRQEMIDSLKGVRDVNGWKSQRLSEITGSKEKFMEAVGKRDEEERNRFAKEVEQHSIQIAAKNDWIQTREIPADATPEQRKSIEAENAQVKARTDSWVANVRASYERDPEKTSELAAKAVEADYLREQNESITKERDKATARVKELEARLEKFQKAGRMAHAESPGAEKASPKTAVREGEIGGDGESAVRNFFANRN